MKSSLISVGYGMLVSLVWTLLILPLNDFYVKIISNRQNNETTKSSWFLDSLVLFLIG